MPRVPVYHLTPLRRLPLIEEEGLRTRADLSDLLGPIGELDERAPGTFGHGKRVSAFLDLAHAKTTTDEHGAGLVSFTVDPAKALAAPASARMGGDVAAYWEAARPLKAWLDEGDAPTDLEVHQNVPVRSKFLHIHAPLVGPEELGDYAPLVDAVADEDRLSAKALMHLAVIACEADFASADWYAACALAWRESEDPERLVRELVETDPDKVASAALAEYGTLAPDATARLRTVLDETRAWADENGLEHGRGLFARTALVLDQLPAHA
ncbi:MAG: hypothetical protein KY457_01745 [Actinobacteria bacterium]|nr:hypothetical protein [Actinomycetota bacterium]